MINSILRYTLLGIIGMIYLLMPFIYFSIIYGYYKYIKKDSFKYPLKKYLIELYNKEKLLALGDIWESSINANLLSNSLYR